MRTPVVLLVSALLTAGIPLAASASTDPVENTTTGVGYPSISAALAAAGVGDHIVVRPGTYAEGQLTLAVEGVTLCSTVAGGTDCDGSPSEVVIDGAGAMYPVFITADFVTVTGFTIQNPTHATTDQTSPGADPSLVVVYGADDVYVTGNVLRASAAPLLPGQSRFATVGVNVAEDQPANDLSDRVTINGNTIRDLPSAVGPDGTCANACRTVGIDLWGAGESPFIIDNTIVVPPGTPGEPPRSLGINAGYRAVDGFFGNNDISAGATPTGAYGAKGTFGGSSFVGNTFTGFQHGLFAAGSGLLVEDNTFSQSNEGLRLTASASEVNGNTFFANNIGVQLAGPNGPPEATGLVFRENVFERNKVNFAFHAQLSGVHVDARENDWGFYSGDLIERFFQDPDGDNTIDYTCYIDEDGAARVCPPTADFTFSPNGATWGTQVQFVDATVTGGRDIVSWRWDFGGVGSSTAQSPRFAFPRGGTYAVTLTVTNEEGWTDSETRTVTVLGDPHMNPIGNKAVDVYFNKGRLVFTISAQDPDGPSLTFSATNLPPGSNFNPANRTFWWYAKPADRGLHTGVTFSVTDGTYTDSETITINVLANPRPAVTVSAAGTDVPQTSPGQAVTLAYKVRNGGLDTNTFALTTTAPAGWTATPAVPSVTLARGEETTVSVSVVPDGSAVTGAVVLKAASADGARGQASRAVALPVALDVELDFGTFFLSTPVTGTVSATWLDGSDVQGLSVLVSEQSTVQGRPVGGSRSVTVVTDAEGVAAFQFAADPLGSTMPGEHTVTASAAGFTGSATYRVV